MKVVFSELERIRSSPSPALNSTGSGVVKSLTPLEAPGGGLLLASLEEIGSRILSSPSVPMTCNSNGSAPAANAIVSRTVKSNTTPSAKLTVPPTSA